MPTAPDDAEIELIRRSGVALRVGRLSLSAGTGSYRVKASMARAARALGIERHQAHVTLTEITTTSHRGPSFRTEVTEVRSVGINADRLCALERFAQDVERDQPVSVEDATARLDRIQDKPPLYPAALNALWAAMACAAFAFLNHGGVVEIAGVFLGAGLGQALRRALIHRGWNQFGVTMLAAALATTTYVGFLAAFGALGGAATNHEAGYVSAVLFLVPGFPLVTGALDLAKLDFSAGLARLTYALMILTSAALSVWGVSMVVGLDPVPAEPMGLDPALLVSLRALASFLGVLGFALMFNSPWSMALAAASIGMVANTGRLWLVDADVPVQAAAAAAALLVGLLAAVVAPRMNVPRVTVSVPAVVIMVPGASAYRAIYHVSNGATSEALTYAVEATLVVAALAIGLAIARMLTDPEWGFER
ncbi:MULTISPECIES: threonine/serine exporter ThrE family protein [Isoptericola]|uniref:Threonine/serine exporter family protein n=1 Tax=Isoptericola sediminis TaxID=2733572 RepID=A0A849K489_9MICO|nr:threonine/serine exporter family protein [Isoptericola sp. 178]MDO8143722.1 threonine/serine exporter family protein [Isoptericola sp. 178]NNU27210.1 threonine/serine exporter family protein [Isoptericola sediminis]